MDTDWDGSGADGDGSHEGVDGELIFVGYHCYSLDHCLWWWMIRVLDGTVLLGLILAPVNEVQTFSSVESGSDTKHDRETFLVELVILPSRGVRQISRIWSARVG